MMKIQSLLLLASILLLSLPLSGKDFPLTYQLPSDLYIKQVVEAEITSIEELTRKALQSTYDASFMASFVPQSIQSAFVATYNDILASLLPASNVQIGKATKRSDLIEVPFCIHQEQYLFGSFVWTENTEGQFVLLSLSINQTEP